MPAVGGWRQISFMFLDMIAVFRCSVGGIQSEHVKFFINCKG